MRERDARQQPPLPRPAQAAAHRHLPQRRRQPGTVQVVQRGQQGAGALGAEVLRKAVLLGGRAAGSCWCWGRLGMLQVRQKMAPCSSRTSGMFHQNMKTQTKMAGGLPGRRGGHSRTRCSRTAGPPAGARWPAPAAAGRGSAAPLPGLQAFNRAAEEQGMRGRGGAGQCCIQRRRRRRQPATQQRLCLPPRPPTFGDSCMLAPPVLAAVQLQEAVSIGIPGLPVGRRSCCARRRRRLEVEQARLQRGLQRRGVAAVPAHACWPSQRALSVSLKSGHRTA